MRSMRKEHVEGGNADPVEEVRSEERDATEPGESSHERRRGGAMPHGVENIPTEEKHGRESAPEERKHGGHLAGPHPHRNRRHGGAMPHETKAEEHREEEKKRHKRRHGGKVPGKAAKGHPGRRARGGGTTADLHPNTAAGSMQEPEYMRDTEGNSDGGKGADTTGGLKTVRGGRRD